MPLESSVLHSGLASISPSYASAQAASEWVRAMLPYIQASVPGAANPPLVYSNLESTLGTAMATLVPGTFPSTLQSALTSFWTSFIPIALPGNTALLIPPTLSGSIRAAMYAAARCIDPVTAMKPIAQSIDSWNRSIMYGTPGTGPTTPLV